MPVGFTDPTDRGQAAGRTSGWAAMVSVPTGPPLNLWCPQASHHAVNGRVEVLADALAVAGRRLRERGAGVGDHPSHELGHRIGRGVIGVDASLNAAQQQLAHVVVRVRRSDSRQRLQPRPMGPSRWISRPATGSAPTSSVASRVAIAASRLSSCRVRNTTNTTEAKMELYW